MEKIIMFDIKNDKKSIATAIYEWIEIGRDPTDLGEMYIDTGIVFTHGEYDGIDYGIISDTSTCIITVHRCQPCIYTYRGSYDPALVIQIKTTVTNQLFYKQESDNKIEMCEVLPLKRKRENSNKKILKKKTGPGCPKWRSPDILNIIMTTKNISPSISGITWYYFDKNIKKAISINFDIFHTYYCKRSKHANIKKRTLYCRFHGKYVDWQNLKYEDLFRDPELKTNITYYVHNTWKN
jgi:hypothetical protein